MPTRPRSRVLSLVVALPMMLGSLLAVTGSPALAAGTPAGAAVGLSVVRDPANPMNLDATWKAPASTGSSPLDRYLVTVVTDSDTVVSVLPATQTSLVIPGRSWTSRYKVKVSTRNTEGLGTDTGWAVVWPAVASAPTKVSGGRAADDPTTVTMSWGAPERTGISPITGYRVTLRRVIDDATWTKTVTGTSATWTGLDLSRAYQVSVRAMTGEGDGVAGSLMIGNDQPGTPGALVAVRDPQDPTRVRLSWGAPLYTGVGPLSGYQVGRRTSSKEFWTWGPVLPASQLTESIQLDVESQQDFSVRAVNGQVASFRAIGKHVDNAGRATPVIPATPNVPVVIGTSGSAVTVNLLAGLGLGASSLDFKLEPKVGTTFSDTASTESDQRQLVFGNVPDGVYLVTVSGTYHGSTVLLKSGLVTIGTVGQLTASDWEVVRGSAMLSGQTVDIVKSGEVRVLDTRNRITEDATITTTATLHGGAGYGIWTRATKHADGTESGWSFQVDPGYANKFIVRWWSHDNECSTPLVPAVAFPAGFNPANPHQIQVSVHGDRFIASVDGVDRLVIPSIQAAVASSPCKAWPVPHGTRVGMRSWSTSSSTFVGTTLTD